MNGTDVINEQIELNEKARIKAAVDFAAKKAINPYPLHSKQRAVYAQEIVKLKKMNSIRVQAI
jgi:hypothetical protein